MRCRRVISCVAAMALLFALAIPCFAASGGQDAEILRYEPVCNAKAYHELQSHWIGTAMVNGEVYISGGSCWQCSGCNYSMITQGDVTAGFIIGKWAGYGYSTKLGALESVILEAEGWGSCYSTTMEGYQFVNAPL